MTAPASETSVPASASLDLRQLLENSAPASQITASLDALPWPERLAQVLAVTGSGVRALYEAMAEAPALTLDEVVPAGEKGTVIYEGRNSLPLFSRFQKRFARTEGGVIVGYNHQTMSFVTGPGYFVVKAPGGTGEHGGELYFDYTAAPPASPSGWPAYAPNERGFSRVVYMGLVDYMRRVARGVVVGMAYKRGKPEGSYFSLSREA